MSSDPEEEQETEEVRLWQIGLLILYFLLLVAFIPGAYLVEHGYTAIGWVLIVVGLGSNVILWIRIGPGIIRDLRAANATVIVAYFIRTEDGLGALAENITDVQGEESWKNKLRSEMRMPNADVRLFYEDEWQAPPLQTHSDVHEQNTLNQILGGIAISLDRLEVADSVVNNVVSSSLQILRMPTSGRVILFLAVKAPREKLGQLLA